MLTGLIVVDGLRPGQTGHRKAIFLVAPLLERHGVRSVIASLDSLRSWARAFMSALHMQDRRRLDFVLFNSTAAILRGRLLANVLWAIGEPLFIYWREGGLRFKELERRYPRGMSRMDRFVGRAKEVNHLANSSWCAQYLSRRYPGIRAAAVGDCAYVPPPFDQPALPSNDPAIVLNVGTVQYKKGSDLFIEAAARVCQRYSNVEFIWIGDGPDREACCQDVRERGLATRVLFPGYCGAPYVLLRRASAFFNSSREDTFSQATAEAMCVARSVVTFESGGPPEILGGCGTVIGGFDTDAAAEALLEVLRKEPERRLVPAARERYLQCYTPERHAERLAGHLYRGLEVEEVGRNHHRVV